MAASFDRRGRVLLYGVPDASGALRVTLRGLESDSEGHLDVGTRRIASAAVDAAGYFAWVVAHPVRGTLGSAAERGAVALVRSLRDAVSDEAGGAELDDMQLLLVPVNASGRRQVLDARDAALLALFGRQVLVADRAGAVFRVTTPGEGERVPMVPADCRAHLLQTWAASDTVLVRCMRGERETLELFSSQTHQVLAVSPSVVVPRRLQVPEERYAFVDGRLIDLQTWQTHDLGARPVAIAEDRVVLRRDGRLVWRDLVAGEERSLGAAPRQTWLPLRAGRFVQLGQTLVDLRDGRRLDVDATTEPLALDQEGRLLMPMNGWEQGVACGPVAWWPHRNLGAYRPANGCQNGGPPASLVPFNGE
ncbi:MAG TPA: hypothetical protein RMH99_01380 [Sandaracinaceae bacterium LLY-WYZ-13_1]|nr:hypothetical protein [Sandaracinaceae bacterium LLY-WYZ-13_1]